MTALPFSAARPDLSGPRPRTDLRGPARAALLATLLLALIFGGWAALTPITGAVIAPGQAVVLGQPRPVQTLDGGAIAEVLVANGDEVAAGDLLLRLDPSLAATSLAIAQSRLAEALALRARLLAEQQGLEAPDFRYDPLPFPLPDTAGAEASQRAILAARRAVQTGQEARAHEAAGQIDAQIAGIAGQIAALDRQKALLEEEISNLRQLSASGLVRQPQITEAERSLAVLEGESARLAGETARLATARREAELAGAQIREAAMENIVTELRSASAEIEELTFEILSHQARLDRVEIRAPLSGTVHGLAATSPGAVLAPGAMALEILPMAEGVEFEVLVDPRAIDQVHPGQRAELHLSALGPQAAKLSAEVITVPPDAEESPQTGARFYRVTLRLTPEGVAGLAGTPIRPGMPVEAYLATGSHSVLAWLLDPVRGHFDRAFRE